MKTTSVVRRLLVGAACVSLLLGTTAMGAPKKSEAKPKSRVILVYVTGSLIPQRVVLKGQQVNSASPLYVVRNSELHRTGARDVAGMLRGDPSIVVRGF
jgi:hypothetical protein